MFRIKSQTIIDVSKKYGADNCVSYYTRIASIHTGVIMTARVMLNNISLICNEHSAKVEIITDLILY